MSLSPLTDEQRAQVEKNYRLALHFAKKYSQRDDADDIRQEICIGLMEAVQTHDPKRGSLATHTRWKISGALLRHQRKSRWLSGTSQHKELPGLVSTETVLGDDFTVGDTLPADGPSPEELAGYRERLSSLMPPSTRSQEIIRLRVEGYTLDEIGAEFGISRERIRQIINDVRERLRA